MSNDRTNSRVAFLTITRVVLIGVVVVSFARTSKCGDSNSLMDISTDGKRVVCSNRDSGSISIIDTDETRLIREVFVGSKPEGVTFVGDTYQVAVAVYGDDVIAFVDSDTGTITNRVDVFDEPYGIVSSRDGAKLYATLDYPGRVVEIDPVESKVEREFQVGEFTRGIALSEQESRLYVTEYYSAAVLAVDLENGAVVNEWQGASTDNLLRQIVLHPERPKAYFPHIRSKVTAVHGDGSIFPYVGIADTDREEGRRRKRIPMDAFLANRVTTNPWEVAVAPDGETLYVVFASTNDMFVCDVLDDNYRELDYRRLIQVGANPRAVKVSPDNETVYVYQALDFNVVAYSTRSLEREFEVIVTENPLDAQVFEGKRLFYSALQPMVRGRWISCSSCHPDGDSDGQTWHNPEGLRNTQSFAGMAWTHPIHWSADRDEVQDFEHTIRGPLMQGRGLVSGRLNDSLADPNEGLSDALDALAAYANSHSFPLSPYAKDGLSESAQRGRELFLSDSTQCASCHGGPFYTDSQPRSVDDIVRHDVGTGESDESELMGPAYDTPTLLGVYRTAPYLHHGVAETLESIFTEHNPDDRHGVTSHLSPEEINDLVEFLKSLPFEDPVPSAEAAGLERVD